MIQTVLLAVDGSAGSDQAIKMTASIARRFNAKVVVVHAFTPTLTQSAPATDYHYAGSPPFPSERMVHPYPEPSILNDEPYQQLTAQTLEAIAIVETSGAQLNGYGVTNVETRYQEGPVLQVLLGQVDNLKPDMLIIGGRGSGTWKGSGLGSISAALIQRVDCSVLVVKSASQPAPAHA